MYGFSHYESVRKEIIRLLQKERKRRKLSNYAVSKRCGVSQTMLSLVDRGLRNPKIEILLRIADGIGASLPAIIEKAARTIVREKNSKSATQRGRPGSKL